MAKKEKYPKRRRMKPVSAEGSFCLGPELLSVGQQ